MNFAVIKCHGSGNDFPMIDARGSDLGTVEWSAIARVLADRGGAIGGDGLLLLTGTAAEPGFRMFNSDGSEAETCLNGVRCVARAAFEAGGGEAAVLRLIASEVAVARAPDLAAGVYTVRERAAGSCEVASWLKTGVPTLIEGELSPLGSPRRFTAIAMPNPHLVFFTETIDEDELVALGLACEAAPDWLPARANVSAVTMRPDGMFVRTHERGVGLTDSCGSAMAAATYAACLTGRWDHDRIATVWNRGGLVRASADVAGVVTIEGNATYEWRGTIAIDPALGPALGTVGGLSIDERFDREIAAWNALKTAAQGRSDP